ncbi:MAG TPA: FAD-binding oxidoreductase [Thermoplasmata archaeon]|nr:FAD-binding oxidoreductase [Thermoplasmata archaeon]
MVNDRADVLILGAGIAGCALAYHLAKRSVRPVVVYDPQTPGAGATGRAAGVVTEQLWDPWDVAVARESKAEYAEFAARWDPSSFSVNGFARWTKNREAVPVLHAAVERLRGWSVPVSVLDLSTLAEKVPWGRFDDVLGAIWSPDDAVVTPSTMGELYAEAARQSGVEFVFGSPLTRFVRDGDSWELVTGGRTIRAQRTVVAAGAWSKRLLASVGHPLPLAPYRTQAAVLRPSSPETRVFPSVHDIDLDVYVRPEANGRILAGDGTELVEVDPDLFSTGGDERFVAHLAESFGSRFPGWADAELVRAWAGVCVSTPDRRALIGPVPGASGLFTITGFNGFGVMRAGGAAARLATVLATGAGSERELERIRPVLPSRFTGPVGDFPIRPGFTLEGGDDPRF